MFKTITNPYIVGNPIKTKKMFYGRQDDFEFIRKKLESGKKSYIIVLSGERRSGKTSILFQILNGELGENFIPILIDMQTMAGLKNESEFFEKFTQETLRYLDDRFSMDNYNYHLAEHSPYKIFSKLLDDMHRIFPYKNKLFLIDEYELIEMKSTEGSLSPSFVPFLSGVLESERRISFVFTGSKALQERDSTYWQNLFGKSIFRNVSFLSQQDTIGLITQPVEGQITFSEQVLASIYRLTSGQPFYTQIVGQHIVDFVNEHEQTHIEPADLDSIVNEILENPLPQMIYFWNNLPESQKLILSLLAEVLEDASGYLTAGEINKKARAKKLGLNLDTGLIKSILEALYHHKYVSKTEDAYCFQIDLLRQWIKRDHSIWRVLKEVDIGSIIRSEHLAFVPGDGEGSPPSRRKKRTWLVPAAAIVFVGLLTAGWLIFSRQADSFTADQPRSISTDQKPASEEKISGTGGTSPPAVNIPTEKSVAKPSQTESGETVKRMNNSRPSRTIPKVSTPAEPEDVDRNAGAGTVEPLRLAMQQSKREAEENGAVKSATSTFEAGVNAEREAEVFITKKEYNLASQKYAEAQNYYKQAGLQSISASEQAQQQIAGLRQQLEKIQAELKPEHRSLTACRNADNLKQKGNDQFSTGDYSLAVQTFSEAINLYQQSIQTRITQRQKINMVIQGYARALENENLAGTNFILNSYKQELERQWSPFFKVAENIKIQLHVQDIAFAEKTAGVSADVLLNYSGAGGSGTRNIWKFELMESGADWLITGISESK